MAYYNVAIPLSRDETQILPTTSFRQSDHDVLLQVRESHISARQIRLTSR